MILQGRWSPTVRASLQRLIEGPAGVATFDWDLTCSSRDLTTEMARRIDPEILVRYEQTEKTDEPRAYRLLVEDLVASGVDLHALAASLREYVAVRPEMVQLVDALNRRGWTIWIVSAAEETSVKAVAPALVDIPVERVLGAGTLDGVAREPFPHRQGKVDLFRQHCSDPVLLAAGDAHSDLELLRNATHQLVMDRGVEALLQPGFWIEPSFA